MNNQEVRTHGSTDALIAEKGHSVQCEKPIDFEQERFGTAPAWARELGLSERTVKRRLKDIQGVTGKIVTGLVLDSGFYPESLVYEACKDLLEELPQANAEGFIHVEEQEKGVCLGTIEAWSRKFEISQPAIMRRLHEREGRRGKDVTGHIRTFYEESTVRELCTDLIESVPQADDIGFIVQEQRYATIETWAKELQIGRAAIRRRIEKCIGIRGKTAIGTRYTFYPEKSVRELCADLLQNVPQTDSSGFFAVNEMRYGSIKAWVKERRVPEPVLRERLKGKGIAGKDASGKLWGRGFYSEHIVDEACTDLPSQFYLEGLPKADSTGFFMVQTDKGQERYGTKLAWATALGVSDGTIDWHLKEAEGIDGRNRQGFLEKAGFYAESALRQKCPELFQVDLPRADASGFFILNDERYGTKKRWSEQLEVSDGVVDRYLEGVAGTIGRNPQGQPTLFYPESALRQVCPQFFEDLPSADATGFFMHSVDGNTSEKYGTAFAWSKIFPISVRTIKNLLQHEQGISGRNGRGKVAEHAFYPESVVRRVCEAFLSSRRESFVQTSR